MKLKHLLPITLISTPLVVNAAGKHVHGEAELFLALEGNQLLIEMESPADNLIGFEHKPSNTQQKKILEKAIMKLQTYSTLINIKEGGCKQVDADVESPFKEAHEDHHEHEKEEKHDHHDHGHEKAKKDDHHDHGHEKEEKEHEEGHSEFHISYTLTCESTEQIKNIQVTAFEQFPNFEKIQVNWVTPKGQGSQVMTGSKAVAKIQ
ncbi:MAG: DUF2796 domain-containing protein [Cellvibrionaceae bacterium]